MSRILQAEYAIKNDRKCLQLTAPEKAEAMDTMAFVNLH